MTSDSYTNDELARLGDIKPTKGVFCPRCRNYIPKFSVIGPKEEERIRMLGPHGYAELRKKTGCSAFFAKLWIIHPHGPHEPKKHPPCPYCGSALPTEKSQQCLHCGWDWHDFDHPIQHPVIKRPNQPPEPTRFARGSS